MNAYPVNATAFSVTGQSLDTRHDPRKLHPAPGRASHSVRRSVPGRAQLAERLSMRQPIALLDNDGVIVCGGGVLDAFDRLEVLEATAEAIINGRVLGEITPMPNDVITELRTAFKLP